MAQDRVYHLAASGQVIPPWPMHTVQPGVGHPVITQVMYRQRSACTQL